MSQQVVHYFQMEQYSGDRIASEVLQRYELCDSIADCLNRVAHQKYGIVTFFSNARTGCVKSCRFIIVWPLPLVENITNM